MLQKDFPLWAPSPRLSRFMEQCAPLINNVVFLHMFRNVFPSLSARLLILALVLASVITAGSTPQGVNAEVGNNAGNWADGEWVCSKGTPPTYGSGYFIGVEYDCTLAIASGRVMTLVADNSYQIASSVVNTNLATKGLTVTLVDSDTKVRVHGTPIARTSPTSGLSNLRYEFYDGVVYKGKEELSFRTELLRINGSATVSSAQPAIGDTVTFTAIPNTLPTGYTVEYVWKNGSTQETVAGEIASTMNYVATGYGTTCFAAYAITSWSDGANSVVGLPLTSFSSLDLVGSVCFSVVRPRPVSVVTSPTTIAPTITAVGPTGKAAIYVNAVPGITVTDPIVYRAAPKRVAENSAVIVLTRQQTRTLDVETRTPAVCLPNDNDLVFISEGSCIADVVNQRTRVVLRTLRTKVVSDGIEELLVGNEIITLAPVYFGRMSARINAKGRQTLRAIRSQAITAGSILVMGHSGVINGNSPENQKLANDRAEIVVKALKSFGVKAPFVTRSVGASNPVSVDTSEKAQIKNRRVVIALIP